MNHEKTDLKDYLMKQPPKQDKVKKQVKKQSSLKIFNPNKHMKEVMELLDEEKKQSLFLPWNKLEKGIKYERLCHFLQTQKNKYTMNETQYSYNRELITDLFKNNNLNKLSDVKYDVEQGEIVSLTKLKLNETHLIYEII